MSFTTLNPNLRRISSRKTFFYKRVFPVVWFTLLILFVIIIVLGTAKSSQKYPTLLVIFHPLAMMGIGYLIMRKFIFDLMDEVYDAGDRLIVRYRNQGAYIPLVNIMNVNYTQMMSPVRITLTLRQSCIFGKTIVFCPITAGADYKSFGFTNALANELIERLETIRNHL